MFQDRIRHGHFRASLALGLGVFVGACAGTRTRVALIPRFAAGESRVAKPDLGGDLFRIDRDVAGQKFTLLAVAVGNTLTVGARVKGSFAGNVTWRVGNHQLKFVLGARQPPAEIPIEVMGELAGSNFVGRATGSQSFRQVDIDLPLDTLTNGNGALQVRFIPGDGGAAVSIPATGALRGVYILR
jgi:hypothetical protein